MHPEKESYYILEFLISEFRACRYGDGFRFSVTWDEAAELWRVEVMGRDPQEVVSCELTREEYAPDARMSHDWKAILEPRIEQLYFDSVRWEGVS